ncbi:hybrid sensor histidine kinase/response regulator [Anaerolineae bacterium CFX9]|nr:hybrid sensor histidine kinase/response regulator [Anaerolineae bacterium CFX9]
MSSPVPSSFVPSVEQGEEILRPRVLIVDDEESNRVLLGRALTNDYEVMIVSSGQAALDAIATHPFDCVILDINMPVMDGFAVLRTIRKVYEPTELPVILMSGRSDAGDIVQGLGLGASDYITKPITLSVTAARLRTQVTLKRLADDNKRTIHDLHLAQKMQERFYRIVSHDLKGPLTNLRMAQYLLRDLLTDNPAASSILENIDLSLNEMQDMIRVFLDVAAAQPGQVETRIICLDPVLILRNVANMYTLNAGRKQIQIAIDQNEPVLAYADQRLLTHIVSNLVSNAIKYSPPHTLTRLGWERLNDHVRIYVADQGPGIPEAERDGLFKMYGKLSNRPTGEESSTGLGLWIVRHLADLIGGDVGVECPPEGGSVFWVELPACDEETPLPQDDDGT